MINKGASARLKTLSTKYVSTNHIYLKIMYKQDLALYNQDWIYGRKDRMSSFTHIKIDIYLIYIQIVLKKNIQTYPNLWNMYTVFDEPNNHSNVCLSGQWGKQPLYTSKNRANKEREWFICCFYFFGLIGFYGISTFVDHLIPHPFFIEINNFISNNSV